jgi:hypothetical protein
MGSSQSIIAFLGFLPDLLVLIFCISYLSKAGTSDATLLFLGSLIRLLVRVFYFVMPYFAMLGDSSESIREYISVVGAVGVLGSVLFCAGFVILIKRVTSTLVRPRA